MRSIKTCGIALLWLFVSTVPALCAGAQNEPQTKEPDPMVLLHQMCDYLGSLHEFSFRAAAAYDEVYTDGKKLQYGAEMEVFVKRPDMIRVNAAGDILDKQFFLRGGSLTLYDKNENVYATLQVPKTIEGALAKAHNEYNLRVSLTELANPHLWELLSGKIQNALYVGTAYIGSIPCYHLAFDSPDVELQVWLEVGKKPLPLKVVFVQKKIEGEPQWTAYLNDWKTSANLSDGLFKFTPPAGVQKIKFVPRIQSSTPGGEKGGKS